MKTLVVYSGGMDSFTLLRSIHQACVDYPDDYTMSAISFNYGQRHRKELDCAVAVCGYYEIDHEVVNLSCLQTLLPGSSLTDPTVDVPEGHYEEESMKATVVPNRNMIMLSIAAAHAIAIGADRVVFGAHSGDHAIYPDCRGVFIASLNETVRLGNYDRLSIEAPYLSLSKGQILACGKAIGLTARDYLDTWTCYKGEAKACGKCGACQERLEAFESVGWVDPLPYQTKQET